jgi:hypothetical protein
MTTFPEANLVVKAIGRNIRNGGGLREEDRQYLASTLAADEATAKATLDSLPKKLRYRGDEIRIGGWRPTLDKIITAANDIKSYDHILDQDGILNVLKGNSVATAIFEQAGNGKKPTDVDIDYLNSFALRSKLSPEARTALVGMAISVAYITRLFNIPDSQ